MPSPTTRGMICVVGSCFAQAPALKLMTTDVHEPLVVLPQHRQFTLRGLFTMMTGTGLFLGLASLHPGFGPLAGLVLVGPWWTHAAYRGEKGNLAYVLAAVTAGAVSLAAVVGVGGWLSSEMLTPRVEDVCCSSAATLLSALVLRRLVRSTGRALPLFVGIMLAWLTILFYLGMIFTVEKWELVVDTNPLQLIVNVAGLAVGALLLLILTIPLSGPLSMAVAWLLWRIDARAIRWSTADQEVLDAVGQLQAEGEPMIHVSQIAERLGQPPTKVAPRAERLRQAARLDWTYKAGYRAAH